MRAISLWQPWASLIAVGLKPYETRHWHPGTYRVGHRIAIHATARKPGTDDVAMWMAALPVGTHDSRLPLGAIVCTAYLAGAYKVLRWTEAGNPVLENIGEIADDGFGDYSVGRYCWHLIDIERCEPPIRIRGAQGWWDWCAPGDAQPAGEGEG